MAHRQFELIPGRPALWWFDLFRRIGYLSLVPFAVAVIAFWLRAPLSVFLIAAGAMLVLNLGNVLSLRRVPGEAAELRAGYTTLYSRNQHVPQVDPVTGVVIREADEPLLARRVPSGTQVLQSTTGTPRPRFWRGRGNVLAVVAVAVLIGVATVVIPVLRGADPTTRAAGPIVFLFLIAVALVVAWGYERSKTSAVLAAHPGAVTFTVVKQIDLYNGLKALDESFPANVRPNIPVAVAGGVISFLHGKPPQPFATIDRAAVTDAYLEVGLNEQGGELARLVLVVRGKGGLVKVPMLLTRLGSFPTSDQRSDEILAAVHPR